FCLGHERSSEFSHSRSYSGQKRRVHLGRYQSVPRKSASQMTLRRHKLRSHTARHDWGYKCPYCYESYMEPASYQQHVQSRHFGRSATFGCPYMQCMFQSKCFRHFREHLAKHNSYESNTAKLAVQRPAKVKSNYYAKEVQNYLITKVTGKAFFLKICKKKKRFLPCITQRRVFWIYPSPGGHITKKYVKNRLGTYRATPTEHDRT
ncbi:unnamed protein product, partial [Heligmosomoides polygyrus]|uniref:C2H2-type domain-containing protein n=1 Tax=Heligmosomoides polygyrus TaxID=6339 RepID=A0A183G192_HELPZ